MSTYGVEIDVAQRNVSHVQVLELVGSGKRVLDVGCWDGSLGLALMEQGCRVSGVEIDAEMAKVAAKSMEQVVVADLNTSALSDHFEAGSFDVIVFADVLEHLLDPAGVLADSLTLLAPEGRMVVSLPNVAHGSLRLAHLLGRWDLTDTGLLDRTHIRFFNRDRIFDLLEATGLVMEELRGTTADPLGVEVEADDPSLPAHVVEWVREQPDAFIYQFQFSARPRRGEEPVGRRIPLVEAAPADSVRARDRHTVRHERILRDELRAVDQMMGLKAEVATLETQLKHLRLKNRETQQNLVAARKQGRALKREAATARRELDQARREIDTRLARRVRRKAGSALRRLGLRR